MEKENSEVLFETPIFKATRGEALPSGLKPVRVAAPDWVTVYVRKSGKILVERQLRFGNGKVVEELPCGMVEPGEDPAEAAARELAEETGIKVAASDLVFLGSANPNPAFMSNTMRWYLANLDKVKSEEVPLKLDADEKIETEWVEVGEFYRRVVAKAKTGTDEVPAMLLAAITLEATASW